MFICQSARKPVPSGRGFLVCIILGALKEIKYIILYCDIINSTILCIRKLLKVITNGE